jgi:molybdenum cofactor cytidylyltransferase
VRSATLTQLRSAFIDAAAQEKWAVIPQYGEKHGHPVLIGREIIEAFLRAPITANAREIEHQHQVHIAYIPVDDPHTTLNVDTPEDYARLQHA